jgi:molybdopterin-guanine dinucleotide biosynthesis protein A
MRTLGVLLAGGRGSRLKARMPKALVTLGGETLLVRARRTLSEVCDEVVVCAPVSVAVSLGIPGIVEDARGGAGPLAGIVAGLASRTHDRAVVLGVDFPRMRAATLSALLDRLGDHDAAIAEPAGSPQPLAAAYGGRAAAKLAAEWERGERSILAAAKRMDTEWVDDAELESIGGRDAFFNVNTPDDLEQAARSIA